MYSWISTKGRSKPEILALFEKLGGWEKDEKKYSTSDRGYRKKTVENRKNF